MRMPLEGDKVLEQFNRLIEELLSGTLYRNTFEPWEIELLLDVHSCTLKGPAIQQVLREYQNVVQEQMRQGTRVPRRLSEYLESKKVGEIRTWQESLAARA